MSITASRALCGSESQRSDSRRPQELLEPLRASWGCQTASGALERELTGHSIPSGGEGRVAPFGGSSNSSRYYGTNAALQGCQVRLTDR